MSLRSKFWIIAILCCVALIAGIATLLAHMMHASSVGIVRVNQTQNGQTTAAAPTEPVPLSTAYFTAVLPPDFTIKHQTPTPTAPFLLQLEANTPATTDEQLAITIGNMPADGLRGIGDYNLRVTESDMYRQTTPSDLSPGAIAFQNVNAPAGLTVFWPHGNLYAELAVSTRGGATYGQLEKLYSQLLAQWKWK